MSKLSTPNSQFSIIIAFIALAILGCALISSLPVKLMPSRTLPSLTVSFSMRNAAARVVEREVTGKLEGLLARIQGVKEINSTSSNGSGYITVGFDKHTDMEQARFEASTIIRQAWPELPDGVSYPIVSASRTIKKSARPILSYTITAPGAASDIMRYAEENIRPAIGRIPGVNNVQFSGATPMEWRLTYDSRQLAALGLSPSAISGAVAEQSAYRFLGTGRTDSDEWLAIGVATAGVDTFDTSRIYLMTKDSTMVSLDRLVKAERRDARPTSFFRVNGFTSIYCNVYADEDANQIEMANLVRRRIADLRLPSGFELHLNYDTTESITSELNKIYFRSGLTLLILLIFVALITLNLRYMLIIIISLLLSLAISVIFYKLLGVEIQLYSLAGITISLNLMIDNVIVMCDHYRRHHNLGVFTAILAATLTTIGTLAIVFFLDTDLRLNLQDFVAVIIINLIVSLAAALWLVPALMTRLPIRLRAPRRRRRFVRIQLSLLRLYRRYIAFGRRWRRAFISAAVLLFGLPVFLLPKEIPGNDIYNKTLGSRTYNENIRPWVNRILGGTLRLFVEDVYEGSYFNREIADPELYISTSLPNGSTLEQMDILVRKMEAFLADFSEIKQFRTDVYSPYQATIAVQFKKEFARNGFPYQLKSQAITKALTLGGGSWSVYGLEDRGFSNDVSESAGSYRVKLLGYNYDELEALAERFRQKLLSHRRIKEVIVSSDFSWYKNEYTEFALDPDLDALARCNLTVAELYNTLAPVFGRDMYCSTSSRGREQILLSSAQSRDYDVWSLMNMPFGDFKLKDFATIKRSTAPKSVVKENQQYRLCLQYEYIGSGTQGMRLLDNDIKEFRPELPLGYTIDTPHGGYRWSDTSAGNYWLLALVIAIIFFITAILFNSLRLPLIIIAMIPLTFIGVFLVFYFTGMNFDQGGFASFILLAGITVNSAIYLLSEYRRTHDYIRAFRRKITPIMLTVLSTILGFIPFMIGRESFWYPLALGTIGGLAASIVALVLLLPVISGVRRSRSGRCQW